MKSLTKPMSVVMIAAVLLLSCSKTETTPSQASQILGAWKAVSYVRTGCTDAAKNEALNFCTTACETFTFTATTVTITSSGAATQTMNIAISGNTITTTPASTDVITFLVSGSTLTITSQSPATGTEANCKGVNTLTKV